jgi:plasmid segregation protein ParM
MKSILALDIGFGNTKAAWNRTQAPGQPDSWSEICFRSVTPRVVVDDSAAGITGMDRVAVTVGVDRFYVGPKATFEGGTRALHPDYINTPEHEALLCGAWHYMLKESGQLSQSVDLLVLGLPVSGFQANRRRLQELGGKVHRVPVPHSLRERSGREFLDVVAKKVLVMPQPMGGLMLASSHTKDFDLFDDGLVSLVIDPGYNTFDWFVADGMTPQLELCGSFQGGVSQILQTVSTQIGFDHGVGSLNFGRVEQALASGEMNLGHKKFSMEPYQIIAKNAAAGVVAEFLQRFDPAKAGISRIYLCGGGAQNYEDALKARLPGLRIEVMDNSVMANVRGFWLAGVDTFAE